MNGQRIGYVRVSSLDQNPDRQLEQISVDRTFTDKASGKDVDRPQLDALLRFAREGDTVVVHSMDRLARNLDDLRQIVRSLTGRGIRVEFVKEGLTFTGEDAPMATLLLSVMGAFAEFERALIRERQRGGSRWRSGGGVPGEEEGAGRRATGGGTSTSGGGGGEGGGGAGVRDQPRDPLPVSADSGVSRVAPIGADNGPTSRRVRVPSLAKSLCLSVATEEMSALRPFVKGNLRDRGG